MNKGMETRMRASLSLLSFVSGTAERWRRAGLAGKSGAESLKRMTTGPGEEGLSRQLEQHAQRQEPATPEPAGAGAGPAQSGRRAASARSLAGAHSRPASPSLATASWPDPQPQGLVRDGDASFWKPPLTSAPRGDSLLSSQRLLTRLFGTYSYN